MLLGLTNAPAGFQALVNDILSDFLNQFFFVYLDDILIFPRTQTCIRNMFAWFYKDFSPTTYM